MGSKRLGCLNLIACPQGKVDRKGLGCLGSSLCDLGGGGSRQATCCVGLQRCNGFEWKGDGDVDRRHCAEESVKVDGLAVAVDGEPGARSQESQRLNSCSECCGFERSKLLHHALETSMQRKSIFHLLSNCFDYRQLIGDFSKLLEVP